MHKGYAKFINYPILRWHPYKLHVSKNSSMRYDRIFEIFYKNEKKLPVGIKIPIGFEQNFHTVSNSDRKP